MITIEMIEKINSQLKPMIDELEGYKNIYNDKNIAEKERTNAAILAKELETEILKKKIILAMYK